MLVVAKIGTSSVTAADGSVDEAAIIRLCGEVAAARAGGHRVVVVTSGAITAGVAALGAERRTLTDMPTLQAVAAVGQGRLMSVYERALAAHALLGGQVLLAPLDFSDRRQYLHARQTLTRLLDLGVVPIVNENDAVADEEIRYGDNDRLAALVAHLVKAELLVLLTDTEGLYRTDPRIDAGASLIEAVVEIDAELEKVAGAAGTAGGSGGMAAKLAAAKIAAFSGVRVVIANAERPGVLVQAIAGDPGVGTLIAPQERRLPARKLWIAFALRSAGTVVVDGGAAAALAERGTSLLPAGVVDVKGEFSPGDAVEITDAAGAVLAKGLSRMSSSELAASKGRRSGDLPEGVPGEVVHRDDLVVVT